LELIRKQHLVRRVTHFCLCLSWSGDRFLARTAGVTFTCTATPAVVCSSVCVCAVLLLACRSARQAARIEFGQWEKEKELELIRKQYLVRFLGVSLCWQRKCSSKAYCICWMKTLLEFIRKQHLVCGCVCVLIKDTSIGLTCTAMCVAWRHAVVSVYKNIAVSVCVVAGSCSDETS
jgi:hypothetical protein